METTKHSSDILLNNFQIKKKRYRVLLNYDHIVWERWEPKYKNHQSNEKIKPKKETEFENEHLSHKSQYGIQSSIVHINEIIRVEKGDTKSASLKVHPHPQNLIGLQTESNQPLPNAQSTVTVSRPMAKYLTIHYAERIVKSPIDCNRWQIHALTLYNTDPYIIAQWHTLLNQKLHDNPTRLHLRRVLVFINPYGGRKEGLQTYERHCKPIFQLAGIDASCVISQRANQIRDIIMSHDLTPYDALCCVGGDGTAAEVINGLVFRAMRDRGLDMRQPAYIPKPTLPIGIIPAGSTDTIAYSVHGSSDPTTAAIHMILGQRRGFDICSVRNRQGIVRFCASMFSYGYLGDVAARSEKYRWMGPKRYEYTGVKAFLTNCGYEAEIRLLEPTEDGSIEEEASTCRTELDLNSICYANCQRCSSVILKHNADGESMDYGNVYRDNLESNPIHGNSNWTLSTEPSLENELAVTDNALATPGDPQPGDVVDKIAPEGVKTPSKNVSHCDIEENRSKAETEKGIPKCDSPVDTKTINSQSSFSFCSTNPTINNINENSNDDNGSANNMATITVPLNPKSKWKVIRGHFFMVSCANITCACSRSPKGMSPDNHLGDGQLDVILVRKTNIVNNVRFALNTMGRNGNIRDLPFVEIYRTRQLHFRAHFEGVENDENMRASTQPIAEAFSDDVADKLVSSWNCDGEVVHDLDVTMTSHCQLIDVFMRGPYAYTKPAGETGKKRICCCIPTN